MKFRNPNELGAKMAKLPMGVENALAKIPNNLRWDIAQLGLDLFGIFDPTPISDGANGFISLCRGDYLGAALSAASMVPGVDVVKILKLERYVGSLQSLVRIAKQDAIMRLGIHDLMVTFKRLVDKLPGNHAVVQKLKHEVDAFLRLATPPKKFALPALKHQSLENARSTLRVNGFTQVPGNPISYRVASSKGGAAGPKEMWSKFDRQSNGYFVVRMDTQGHAFKQDVAGQISVVSQTRSGVHLSHGGRPHYHKEWVPFDEYQTYLSRPTPNVVRFNDAGEIGTGLKDLHIPR